MNGTRHDSEQSKILVQDIFGAAQELKYPIQAVMQHSSQILSKYQNRDFEYISFNEFKEIMGSVEAIHKQMARCYESVHKLTELGQSRAYDRTVHCQPNRVIKHVLQKQKNKFLIQGIRMDLKLQQDLPEIIMREEDFEQVSESLLNNAIQAMPAGGHLAVRTKFAETMGMVHVNVIDEGVGISRENLKRIFDPRFTTKQRSSSKKAGSGLSIVQSLVNAHHGEIRIVSSLRKGTTVDLRIPSAVGKTGKRSRLIKVED